MWHIPGTLVFLGILALFFTFNRGGCGFLLMVLAFLFVLSMLRRASYGPRYRGYGGYRHYNYPPRSYTPGYTYPPQNNPPAEDASQSNPYYANPDDAGAKTVRTGPNDDIVEPGEGTCADTVRIDPPPGAGGAPTRRL